jgi:hypothetical protein
MTSREKRLAELVRKTNTVRSKSIRKLLRLWLERNGAALFHDPQFRGPGKREKRYRPAPSLLEIMDWIGCSKRTAQDYLTALVVIDRAEGPRYR